MMTVYGHLVTRWPSAMTHPPTNHPFIPPHHTKTKTKRKHSTLFLLFGSELLTFAYSKKKTRTTYILAQTMNDPTPHAVAATKAASGGGGGGSGSNRGGGGNRRRGRGGTGGGGNNNNNSNKPNNNNSNKPSNHNKPAGGGVTNGGEGGDVAASKRRRKGSISARPPAVPGNDVCHQFAKNGTCARGEDCRFRHDDATTTTTAAFPANNNKNDVAQPQQELTTTTRPTSMIAVPAIVAGQQQKLADLPIAATSKKAMADVFQYEYLTPVQEKTLPSILQGHDCLARAKTGTGKTLAFLIPTVEKLLSRSNNNNGGATIGCLVLSPNRELALQIHAEAVKLTRYAPHIRSAVVVGGTNLNKDLKVLGGGGPNTPQILIATPGRLLDHLQNHNLRIPHLHTLIFDEFDQLLDQGFQPDLLKILACLTGSKPTRQTLLFSATMPQALSFMATQVLRKDHVFVDTVGEEDVQTHLHVEQRFYQCPWAEQVYAIQSLLAEQMASRPQDYKIIVFFTTARLTGFMAELFNSLSGGGNGVGGNVKILEIHSRKSQTARTKASDQFRAARCAILFSSDVSARGLDYPDVTFVLQVGLTERDQYIHRLGRSGRAGKVGGGALLVADVEAAWMKRTLHDLPLQFVDLVPATTNSRSALTAALQHIETNTELKGSAEQAYRAWLGFYNGHIKKLHWDKNELVEQANQWILHHGLTTIPAIEAKTIGKMGLRGVRGLNIERR
jgi:ATP-dependent RNA helicase MSS116, mitochondrial